MNTYEGYISGSGDQWRGSGVEPSSALGSAPGSEATITAGTRCGWVFAYFGWWVLSEVLAIVAQVAFLGALPARDVGGDQGNGLGWLPFIAVWFSPIVLMLGFVVSLAAGCTVKRFRGTRFLRIVLPLMLVLHLAPIVLALVKG